MDGFGYDGFGDACWEETISSPSTGVDDGSVLQIGVENHPSELCNCARISTVYVYIARQDRHNKRWSSMSFWWGI